MSAFYLAPVGLPLTAIARPYVAVERCRGCGGTGFPFDGRSAWCSLCDAIPVGYRQADPADPPTAYRAVPGGVVLVHRVGPVWVTAAEILAVVFDHFGVLPDVPAVGQRAAGWVQRAAAEVLHPARQRRYQTDTATSLAWLREQLDPDTASEPPVDRLTAEDAARLRWLAGLVAEAFGPTGLAVPPVAA